MNTHFTHRKRGPLSPHRCITVLFVAFLILGSSPAHTVGAGDINSQQGRELPVDSSDQPVTESSDSSISLSAQQLCEVANRFTVKVSHGDNWGSGVLVSNSDSTYSLVTNGHVVPIQKEVGSSSVPLSVTTYDGRQHGATVVARYDYDQATGDDLAVLQFSAKPQSYQIATLGRWQEQKKILSAGFPKDLDSIEASSNGFVCTSIGHVFRKLDRPMKEGYQLGFFLSTRVGMSGGPVVDETGSVVGIQGMGTPVFVNEDIYRYKDGSLVTRSLGISLDLLKETSWSIPTEKIEYLLPRGIELSLDKNPQQPPLSSNFRPLSNSESDELRQIEIESSPTIEVKVPESFESEENNTTVAGEEAVKVPGHIIPSQNRNLSQPSSTPSPSLAPGL